ncbi:MAG: alkaline phosphatase [Armatimonadota bacterium]
MHKRCSARRCAVLVVWVLLASCTGAHARRVILMIGDGMGYKHIEVTRNYVGSPLAMESLPVRYGVSTYEYGGSYSSAQAWSNFNYVKSGATDSASAATAMSCGVKTDNGNIATDHNDINRLETLSEYARARSHTSGVVSTVPFSHATPAAFAAHNNSRNNYTAIAREMITTYGDGTGARGNTPTVQVIIGGGHPTWASGYIATSEYNALKNGTTGQGWTFVERRSGVSGSVSLANAALNATKLFGLYGGSGGNIEYRNANGAGHNPENPTLAEMSLAALTVLDRCTDGFFLMIEGGAIDWASHNNNINQTIGEVIGFDQAVAAVMGWVNATDPGWTDTLLIVTADHETGYITRAAGVFPNVPLANPGAGVLPVAGTHFAWNSTGHTNSLVPLFARGVGSNLFAGYATMWDPGYATHYLDNTDINAVIKQVIPEPGTLGAVSLGLAALCLTRARPRRR